MCQFTFARRNGHLSCHARPLPCIPPAMHAPHHTCPPATHAPHHYTCPHHTCLPCHACSRPHTPPAMHNPCHATPTMPDPCHACPHPAMYAPPPPHAPPATHRQTLVKTLPSQTSFAGGNYRKVQRTCNIISSLKWKIFNDVARKRNQKKYVCYHRSEVHFVRHAHLRHSTLTGMH